MGKIKDGGPAFPSHAGDPELTDPRNRISCGGMSLRDWFAGRAMQAFYSSFDARDANTSRDDLIGDAWLFYRIADAMLSAREGSDT